MIKHPLVYRIWQFLSSLRALLVPPEDGAARRLLAPAEYALFRHMARYDRAHCLRVFHLLREQAGQDPLLLKAALLHDVGKSAGKERIPLLYRGPIVIARRVPKLWVWLVRERPQGHPLRPFYLYVTHAARGAHMVRAAGSPEAVAVLIQVHHAEAAEGPARQLQEADRQA